MCVAVDVIPPGGGAIVVAHHLHTILAALVVIGFPMAPVGVREGHAVAPGVACVCGDVSCETIGGLVVLALVVSLVPLTALDRVSLEADPLGAAFAVHSQELLLLRVADGNQITTSGQAVLSSTLPALSHGPVHIVEELEGR